ncbi:neprilysin-1 [Ixodes scapularis]
MTPLRILLRNLNKVRSNATAFFKSSGLVFVICAAFAVIGLIILGAALFPRRDADSWSLQLDRQWHLRDIFRGSRTLKLHRGRKYDYSTEVRMSLDLSANPCNDFYSFVCGRWPQSHPEQSNEFSRLQSDILIAAFKKLEQARYVDPQQYSVSDHAGEAFRYCLLTHMRKSEDFSPFYEILGTFGFSWPQVKDGEIFDILELAMGSALKWGIPLLFDVEVTTDLRTDNGTILRISRSEPLTTWIAQWFKTTDKDIWFAQVPRILEPGLDYGRFSLKVIEAAVSAFSLLLSKDSVGDAGKPAYIKMKDVSLLSRGLLTTERWLAAINRYLPEGVSLGPDDEMHFLDEGFLRNIGDFVRSFESLRRQHSVASMAGWVLAYHMGAALTHRVFANAQDPLSRAVYQCLDLVSEMADYPLSWFLTEQHVTPDDWKATSSLLDDVRESMSHFFDWMDESTKSIALDRLRALRNIVAYPSIAATKHSLETRYSFLRETVKPPFGRAYMETKRMVRVQRNRFLKKAMARQDNDWFSVPLVNAIFLPYYHIIVIPTSIMLPPLLVHQLPAATYGGMAHVLAHEVSHAFDVDAAPANADGLYREWYSPITRSRIQDRKLCLRDMYLVPVNLPWVTEGEDYADALGLTVRLLPTALGYAARKTRPAQYVIVGAESRPAPSGKHGKTRRESPQGGRRVSLG